MRTAPGCGRRARNEPRTSGESPRCPSVAAFLAFSGTFSGTFSGSRGGDRPVAATGQLGCSMRHETELLSQLRFLGGLALGDLVAEDPGAELESTEAVLEPVDREHLGGTPAPHHRVDGGAGSGGEPEPALHAALSSSARC